MDIQTPQTAVLKHPIFNSVEKMLATELLKLAMEIKKSKTEEDGSYHSAEVSPGDRGQKKS